MPFADGLYGIPVTGLRLSRITAKIRQRIGEGQSVDSIMTVQVLRRKSIEYLDPVMWLCEIGMALSEVH